jgi:hypothetical protein
MASLVSAQDRTARDVPWCSIGCCPHHVEPFNVWAAVDTHVVAVLTGKGERPGIGKAD